MDSQNEPETLAPDENIDLYCVDCGALLSVKDERCYQCGAFQ